MNISLIGMPSSGKTTTAMTLGNLLKNFTVIDTDEKIVQREKRTINDIFALNGEEYFRNIEASVLKEILNGDNQIISTGGGIVKSDENMRILKKKSFVIYLKTDLETLFERSKKSSERPLLNTYHLKEKLKNLLAEREDRYNQAHYVVYSNKSPEFQAKEIAKKIYERIGSQN